MKPYKISAIQPNEDCGCALRCEWHGVDFLNENEDGLTYCSECGYDTTNVSYPKLVSRNGIPVLSIRDKELNTQLCSKHICILNKPQ